MTGPKELYGIRIGSVYFTGIGDAGFRLGDNNWETLNLTNARVRKLKDPSVGLTDLGVFIWTEEHLKRLLDYVPNNDIIPSLTVQRKGIDKLVAFLYHNNTSLSK